MWWDGFWVGCLICWVIAWPLSVAVWEWENRWNARRERLHPNPSER